MSRKKINKKEEIAKTEKERKGLIKFILSDCELIEGSIRDVLVRCGRAGCRCENDPIHPVTRLSRWENGKLKNKVVRVADRKWVKKLSDNYKEHKQTLSALVKMNEKERKILKSVIQLKTIKYE